MRDPDFDESAWRERIRQRRNQKDEHLATAPESPFADDGTFDGLSYFDPDPSFRVVARLQWVAEPRDVELPTNRGPPFEYERVATLGFSLDGAGDVLAAFRAPGTDDLLVPFTDETNGDETAETGRYLTLSVADVETGDDVALDFNLAYHPYCVYDDAFVSALPPDENSLGVAVRAGERL